MNKRYTAGRRFEYKVKALLESKGFFVLRSAGSKTLFDLFASNGKQHYLIQCKNYKLTTKDITEFQDKINTSFKDLRQTQSSLDFILAYKDKHKIHLKSIKKKITASFP